jgi:hypothetical protein
MVKLVNRAKMTTATTGTGTMTLGSAVSGQQTFATAGVVNADDVRYVIEDGTAFEIGTGIYTASGTTLSRTLIESSTGSLLNLTGMAVVFVTAAAQDIVQGPASATDNAVARLDTTTGKLIQNSTVLISDTGLVNMPSNATLVTPAANTVTIFGRTIAGRGYAAFSGPSGLDSALQPLLARNKVGYWNPSGNGNNNPGVFGFTPPNITGFTATTRNVETTNMFSRFRRIGYVSATTAGAVGQWRVSITQYTMGNGAGVGGFTYIIRFGISDVVEVAGARMFIGMRQFANPNNAEPSTLTQCVGVGHGAADTNLKIFYGGSVAQTPIDLGANFPITHGSVEMYELALFAAPNTQTIQYEVTRLLDGTSSAGILSGIAGTALPDSTQLIGPWGYRTNNATALAVGLDVASAYIETDF